jgi:undecaprenyl-diphosphatase
MERDRERATEHHRIAVSLELVAVGAVAMAIVLAVVDAVFARQTFDDRALVAVAALRGGQLNALAVDVTALGSDAVIALVLGVGAGVLWLARDRLDAVQLMVAGVGASIAVAIAKLGFARPRPSVVPHLVDVSGFSFPSGHALITTATYATLAIIARRHAPTRGARALVTGAAVLVIVAVAASRVYLGVHYPSDVLAGMAAGLAWALAVSAIEHRARPAPLAHAC